MTEHGQLEILQYTLIWIGGPAFSIRRVESIYSNQEHQLAKMIGNHFY